jgi:hypothetical protein
VGTTQSLVAVTVAVDPTVANAYRAPMVTLTLTGPADVWFGIGWNAGSMADAPYATVSPIAPPITSGTSFRFSFCILWCF